MKNTCENCGCEFEHYKKKRFCSRSCAGKFPFKDPEYRKQNKEKQKLAHNRPEVKEKFRKRMKDYWSNDSNKERQSKRQKEYTNRPEVKEQISKKSIEVNSRPCVKKRQQEATINQWKDDSFRTMMKEKRKEYMNRPEIIEKLKKEMSIRAINMWKDPNFADKHFKRCHKYKEFELPSGRVVNVQGYEPIALSELLKEYSEDDIVIGVKEINKEIGRIEYTFDGKEKTYYPDFYIKSTNTIIEVKSQWTFDKWKDKNLAKQKACIHQGFNFEFKIIRQK